MRRERNVRSYTTRSQHADASAAAHPSTTVDGRLVKQPIFRSENDNACFR